MITFYQGKDDEEHLVKFVRDSAGIGYSAICELVGELGALGFLL